MGYKDDLKKINAALRDPTSKCYDPMVGRSGVNTHTRKMANRRKLARARAVMKWRRENSDKYRAYMRRYMAERRAMMKVDAVIKSEALREDLARELQGE